jgi:hypothetical protein
LDGAGRDLGVDQRRTVAAGPADALVLAQPQQQIELLGEQLVVVVERGR